VPLLNGDFESIVGKVSTKDSKWITKVYEMQRRRMENEGRREESGKRRRKREIKEMNDEEV
jgi:hypothetical protein